MTAAIPAQFSEITPVWVYAILSKARIGSVIPLQARPSGNRGLCSSWFNQAGNSLDFRMQMF